MITDASFFVTLALFAFIMSVTPGPNNMMLLASGAQFGFRRTLPHMVGIVLGMASLLFSVLLGLGTLFVLYPPIYLVLKWIGGAYLLWLAWKVASAPVGQLSNTKERAAPMRWWQASLFQYVNPKAWMMSIGCVSSFSLTGDLYVQSGFWIIVFFACMGFLAITLWAWAGVTIRRWLTDDKRQRIFNYGMGFATASTLLLMIGN